MANYDVSKDKTKNAWKIKKEGATRASSYVNTQKEAEKIAKDLSAKTGGGEVRIHGLDKNKIRDSDTVKPGNDPRNIKDKKH